MSRIDYDSLKRELKRDAMLALVERAAVPVIRCGKCKYFYSVGGDGHIGTCANDPEGMFTHKDWCCGDGERRDDATD